MKALPLLALGIMLCTLPASAQDGKAPIRKIELDKLTCKDLMAGNDTDRDAGISFYHGYLAGKKNTTVIDLRAVAEHTDRVRDYCLSNPAATILAAYAKTAQ